jgi:mono/diheme cytochrome c family protein
VTACGGNTNQPANRPAVGDADAAKVIAEVPGQAERARLAIAGAGVFSKYGCATCHSKTSERAGMAGPPLGQTAANHLTRNKGDELAARRWFYLHLVDPEGHPGLYHDDGTYKATRMPSFKQLSDDEFRALIEYLMTLR